MKCPIGMRSLLTRCTGVHLRHSGLMMSRISELCPISRLTGEVKFQDFKWTTTASGAKHGLGQFSVGAELSSSRLNARCGRFQKQRLLVDEQRYCAYLEIPQGNHQSPSWFQVAPRRRAQPEYSRVLQRSFERVLSKPRENRPRREHAHKRLCRLQSGGSLYSLDWPLDTPSLRIAARLNAPREQNLRTLRSRIYHGWRPTPDKSPNRKGGC